MANPIPQEAETRADIKATALDIERLQAITTNLSLFIADNGGEDRSKFKYQLMVFETTLRQGLDLQEKLMNHLTNVLGIKL